LFAQDVINPVKFGENPTPHVVGNVNLQNIGALAKPINFNVQFHE
jgi:hypothetical protein